MYNTFLQQQNNFVSNKNSDKQWDHLELLPLQNFCHTWAVTITKFLSYLSCYHYKVSVTLELLPLQSFCHTWAVTITKFLSYLSCYHYKLKQSMKHCNPNVNMYMYYINTMQTSNNLCIAPLIFEHRKFSGNSFNFDNFRFLKKLPVFLTFLIFYLRFQKCTKGYIWSSYVHYVYLLIY